jgi:hypothetical protein
MACWLCHPLQVGHNLRPQPDLGSTMTITQLPPIQETFPEVFILESLTLTDERKRRLEGRVLADVLRMCGKSPEYFYFRTEQELEELILEFRRSGYRFLHLSCHANDSELATTYGNVAYTRFAELTAGHLQNRRLFVSACEVGNELFSELVSAKNRGMYSIVSPRVSIPFDKAVALWSALYVHMFSVDASYVKVKDIGEALTSLCTLFDIPFMFSIYHSERDNWEHRIIPGRATATSMSASTFKKFNDDGIFEA